MKIFENECVDCGLPCMGDTCPYKSVPHYYCDNCDEETTLYYYDGEELCINCIKEKLIKVDGSDY